MPGIARTTSWEAIWPGRGCGDCQEGEVCDDLAGHRTLAHHSLSSLRRRGVFENDSGIDGQGTVIVGIDRIQVDFFNIRVLVRQVGQPEQYTGEGIQIRGWGAAVPLQQI